MFDDDALPDDKPLADVVDQLRPARPDDDNDDTGSDTEEAAPVLEADPADVADQRRIAPVLSEDDPWP